MSSLSPGTTIVEQLFRNTSNMASKKATSKDIVESSTGDVVEQMSMNVLVYVDT